MKNKRLGCLALVLALLLIGSLFLNMMLLLASMSAGAVSSVPFRAGEPVQREVLIEKGEGPGKIALIELVGIIQHGYGDSFQQSMVTRLKRAFEQAAEDEKVKAVVLRVDTPGGEVTASDQIYHALQQLREQKPVVVYLDSVAASGGYYVACGGTHLIAAKSCITGSIGVIIQSLKYKELFGKIGLESRTFKSGPLKDMLSGTRDMSPEERDYVESLVMETYEQFLKVVAEERNMNPDTLMRTVADGRILTGRRALDAKLIDSLGYLEDAYAKARELGNAPQAEIILYQPRFDLSSIFGMLGKDSKKVELELLPRKLKIEPGRPYYLPPFLVP